MINELYFCGNCDGDGDKIGGSWCSSANCDECFSTGKNLSKIEKEIIQKEWKNFDGLSPLRDNIAKETEKLNFEYKNKVYKEMMNYSLYK